MSEEIISEVTIEGDEFLKFSEFLTKIRVSKTDTEHKFLVTYPKKFESQKQFVKFFEYLAWYWFMNTAMEREESKGNSTLKEDYAR